MCFPLLSDGFIHILYHSGAKWLISLLQNLILQNVHISFENNYWCFQTLFWVLGQNPKLFLAKKTLHITMKRLFIFYLAACILLLG